MNSEAATNKDPVFIPARFNTEAPDDDGESIRGSDEKPTALTHGHKGQRDQTIPKLMAILKVDTATIQCKDMPDVKEQEDLSNTIDQSENEAQEQSNRRFHFRSAYELSSTPKPTEWLIKPYLDVGSLGVIFGEPGSMKTFVAIDIGLCIAAGIGWHGHPIRHKGPVFYIAGEGANGMNRRIRAWADHHKKDLRDVPFFVSSQPAQMLDHKSAEEVTQAVNKLRRKHGSPSLIIIDTLNRNFGPGDENATSDMTRFVSIVDEMLRVRYRCSVLIIHHSGLSAKERARGASALKAASDWEYRLENSKGTRTLDCTKAKEHEEPQAICFIPEIVQLDGWVDPEDGEALTSCILHRTSGPKPDKKRLSGPKKTALDALKTAIDGSGNDSIDIDEWRTAAYSAGISSGSTSDAKRKAFDRAASALQADGLVEVKNNQCWIKPDNGQTPDIVRT